MKTGTRKWRVTETSEGWKVELWRVDPDPEVGPFFTVQQVAPTAVAALAEIKQADELLTLPEAGYDYDMVTSTIEWVWVSSVGRSVVEAVTAR